MKKGDRFEQTYTVTDGVYRGFMELFGDRNPMHIDEDFAKRNGFGGRVMYGNILNGFISHFIGECLPIKNVVLISQDIAYSKPVYLNDALSFRAEVEDVHESVGIAEFKYTFANREGTKVAKGKIQIRILS